MKYLLLLMVFITTPATAKFGFDDGIRKPQSVVVAGDSVIDDIADDKSMPVEPDALISGPFVNSPDRPIDPFTTPPKVSKLTPVKRTVKKISPVKVQRVIADDRIDDSYVQELMKQKFDFSNPIE